MRFLTVLTLLIVVGWLAPVAHAQKGQYKPVEPLILPLDRSGVWTMNFAYTPPRIISVTMPDGSERQAWYMVYRVWNKTDTPLRIIPEFELTTKDGKLQTFFDEPYPFVAERIRAIEDPTGGVQAQNNDRHQQAENSRHQARLDSSLRSWRRRVDGRSLESERNKQLQRLCLGLVEWLDRGRR